MLYLMSAEALALFLTAASWLGVWLAPTVDRIRFAAFNSALLVTLRAVLVSLTIMLCTK